MDLEPDFAANHHVRPLTLHYNICKQNEPPVSQWPEYLYNYIVYNFLALRRPINVLNVTT